MTLLSLSFSVKPIGRFIFIGFSICVLFFCQSIRGDSTYYNQDSAKKAYLEKIEFAHGDKELLIDTYYEYGEYLDEEEGAYEASVVQFESALKIAKSVNNQEKISSVANYLASMYCLLGDFGKAIEAYEIALESAEHLQDFHNMAKVSMNIAGTYSFMGSYKDAVSYALNAIEIKETNKDLVRICYHYITLGNIFMENDNVSKWKEYVLKAYNLKDVEGCASFDDIAKIYNCLGSISCFEKDYTKALNYYDTLLVFSKGVEYDQGVSCALTNSAQIYYELGKYDEALDLTQQAEAYYGGDTYDIIFNNNWKAELYKELGNNEAALVLVRENIQRNDIQYYYTERIKSLGLLYELNFRQGNYHEAHRWNDSLRTAESQMHEEDARRVIEEMETKYETAKKEKQIELLTVENELKAQRMRTGLVVIFILILLIVFIARIYQLKRKQAQLKENDLQQKVLRAQMNPHFIFNVLSSIQSYMLANDAKKASGYLSSLAVLMRSTLEFSASESITLEKEIGMLRSYVELEQMRMPDRFDFRFQVDNIGDSESIIIPPMLIQPFIENAIKHGFQGVDYKGELRVYVVESDSSVEFVIEDNGVGMIKKGNSEITHQSMAMGIFEERRKLIEQKIKRPFSFKVINLRDLSPKLSGVRIRISVPVLNINSKKSTLNSKKWSKLQLWKMN